MTLEHLGHLRSVKFPFFVPKLPGLGLQEKGGFSGLNATVGK